MFGDVEKLETKILELEQKLGQAKQKRAELNALDPEKRLAVFLHEKFCPHNHTDGCAWWYESGDTAWTGQAHVRWIKHSREVSAAMEG